MNAIIVCINISSTLNGTKLFFREREKVRKLEKRERERELTSGEELSSCDSKVIENSVRTFPELGKSFVDRMECKKELKRRKF